MLFYHGRGERRYDREPIPVRRRVHWEYAAILSGRARPLLADGRVPKDEPALWIFPPRHPHGWTADGSCTVCIVHLAACPRVVADRVASWGMARIPLAPADRERVRDLDARVAHLLGERPAAAEIAADLFRGCFSELAVRHFPKRSTAGDAGADHAVKLLLAWLDEHLHTGVGIREASRAVGLSEAHVRRLCHRVTGRSPRSLLTEARLERAKELLARTDDSIERIAWACGFSSPVSLSHAFVRQLGVRPGAWRREREAPRRRGIQDQYISGGPTSSG